MTINKCDGCARDPSIARDLSCETCLIYTESRKKRNADLDAEIADKIRGYWVEQQNLSTDWRG